MQNQSFQNLVTIRDKRNGQTKQVWPVDASEILKVSPDVYEIVHSPYVIKPSEAIPEKKKEEVAAEEVDVKEEISLVEDKPLAEVKPVVAAVEIAKRKPGPKPKN